LGYLVHLQQFEGPLGLLLYLIRKEEMDIFDINVNEITRQYLEHIRMMKELDLEVAGDFVSMAATLIHIKSRMLLPQYDEQGEVVESIDDPRKELVHKLLEYQKYQEVAKNLYDRPLLGRDVYSRGIRENLYGDEAMGEIITEEEGLFSLIASYRRVMRKAQRAVHKVRSKVQSIASRILELKDHLIVGTRVVLRDLVGVGSGADFGSGFDSVSVSVSGSSGGSAALLSTRLLITFLSILELGRMGFVSVFQNEAYGDIHIDLKKPIERNVLERVQEFEAGDAEAIAKSIIDEAIEEKIDLHEAMTDGGEGKSDDGTFANANSGELVVDTADTDTAMVAAADMSVAVGMTGMVAERAIDRTTEGVATDEEILAAERELLGDEADREVV